MKSIYVTLPLLITLLITQVVPQVREYFYGGGVEETPLPIIGVIIAIIICILLCRSDEREK